MSEPIDQLKTDPPRTGRLIREDGVVINEADFISRLPINIARGEYPGAEPFGSYGERVVAGSEVDFPVWPNGAIVKLPNAGAQITVVSTTINDALLGTHAQTIEFHYLDVDLNPQIEIVELNGTTDVLTQATDIRWIQDVHLVTFGTSAFADGDITLSYDGDVFGQINASKVRSSSSFRMIPAGKIFYLDGAVGSSISATADTTTSMSIVASELENNQFYDPLILFPFAGVGLQNGALGFTFPPGISFNEGALVGGLHTTNKAGTVTMSWFGRLEPMT